MMCRYARDCSECNRPVCPYEDIDDDREAMDAARDDWWDE